MGITGLLSYITNSRLGRKILFENCTVIIDCWALVYHLYQTNGLDLFFGGQTYFFHQTVFKFINENLKYNVKMIIVCDGCSNFEDKLETKLINMNQQINNSKNSNSTRFTLESYYCQIVSDICKELGVSFFVAKEEADRDIAILADSLGGYILSNDSDFYIYNTNPGCISLKSLKKELGAPYTGHVISHQDLALSLNLDVKKLPLIALLSGNVYFKTYEIGRKFSPNLCSSQGRIPGVVQYINRFSNTSQLLEDFKKLLSPKLLSFFNKNINKILSSYNINERYNGMTRSEILNYMNKIIEDSKKLISKKFWESDSITKFDWIVKLFHRCEFNIYYYRVAIYNIHFLALPPQKFSLCSVNDTSLKIRKNIYKIICCNTEVSLFIREFDRKELTYKEHNMVCVSPLDELELKMIINNNLEYFLSELSVSRPPAHLSNMSSKSNAKNIDIILISLKFIKKNSKINYTLDAWRILFTGLLRCLFLNKSSSRLIFGDLFEIKNHNSHIFHLIGEYISTFGCVNTFNILLGEPFPSLPIMYWFDGPLIVDTFINVSKDTNFLQKNMEDLGISWEIFNQAITWISE